MLAAVEQVRGGQSLRRVAAALGLNFKTLANYCKKYNPPQERANVSNEATRKPEEEEDSTDFERGHFSRFGYAKLKTVSSTLLYL